MNTTLKGEHGVENYAVWFGARLREAWGDAKQTELAKLMQEDGLDIKTGRISHYMQGRRYPDPPLLKGLARALGVSADWLLGLTEQKLPVADLEEMLAQAKGESRINKIVKQLPTDKHQQVIDFAEFVLARHLENVSDEGLTQRQRDDARAARVLDSVDKEFGGDVRIQLEKFIRSKGSSL